MKMINKTAGILTAFVVMGTALYSQTNVEDLYVNEEMSAVVIASLADSDELDNKLVALEMLENAVQGGDASEAVVNTLHQLAGEGVSKESRKNGRMINNFPPVRRRACQILANVKTEQVKDYLIDVTQDDKEPSVIAAAVKSLAQIGLDVDNVVNAISFANKRNMALNPTSSLAYEVLEAYEILAPNVTNKKLMMDSIVLISTNYKYNSAVRNKAKLLFRKLSQSK